MNRIRIHVLPSSRGRLTPIPRLQEPQACSFTHRPCSQPRLEGQDFCLKHILQDKNAPFKQCSYVSSRNGRRCPGAAPKLEKKDGVAFCAEHARKNALAGRVPSKKTSAGPSPEMLLAQLSGYMKSDLGSQGPENSRSEASKILDDDSWSEGEPETVLLDQTWRGDPDSEADSIDSDQEDPLKHAGVYTAEEVALVMREKLIRLQSLYIDQFKRLQHLLREKKRRYLHTCKLERESIGSSLLTGPEGTSSKERVDLRKLKALRRYRRRYGVEALLHRQLKERRVQATEGSAQHLTAGAQAHSASARAAQRCAVVTEGARCSAPSLPMSRHCLFHICQDPNQVLFKLCSGMNEVTCTSPMSVSISEDPCCPLHLQVPPQMYRPERAFFSSEQLDSGPADMYLSAADLQPTEILPLEFSDDCLDVVGDSLHCPPSPLFDPALGPGGQSMDAPAEMLTDGVRPRRDGSESDSHHRTSSSTSRPSETGWPNAQVTGAPGQGGSQPGSRPRGTQDQNGTSEAS